MVHCRACVIKTDINGYHSG